jgi:hypothetical protein
VILLCLEAKIISNPGESTAHVGLLGKILLSIDPVSLVEFDLGSI